MPAEESAPKDRAAFHRLSVAALDVLVSGDGDREVVGELVKAELSRRKLLLRALLDQTGERASADAWALLEQAQRRAPEVVDDVLLAPGTGIWLSRALRRLRGQAPDDAPTWVTLGHLSAVAVAAAGRAGIGFTATVPVRHGYVHLPTLGCAVLPAEAEAWSTAQVTGRAGGELKLSGHQQEAIVVAHGERRPAEWLPTRRITVGPPGHELVLTLEECDPYRTYLDTSPPRVLSEAEAARWEAYADEAWHILLRDEPAAAEGMRRGLLSITPMRPTERFRPYSSSAGDAFGGMNASLPDGGSDFAATLVHEFQHIKLGALIHLYPLLRPARPGEEPELFHAPWRDDPRPLEGLLQGIYAFFGVARFWRAHRHAVDPADAPVAHFEYVFWRDEVRATLQRVRGHERFTPLGSRLIVALGERCERWAADDDIPPEVSRLAEEAASDHLARWREHHLRPPAPTVAEAVRAWRRGASRAPAALAAEPAMVPDPAVAFLDTAAVLARHALRKGDGDLTDTAGGVRGADAADVLLARGDRTAAVHALGARLRDEHVPVGTWAVLGRALADDPAHRAASRVLRRFPERARALHDALLATGGEATDPVALADWLGADGAAV